MNGPIAVCFTCGAVCYARAGHACAGRPHDTAGTSATESPTLVPAVTLPDGTPHPDPFLAERGWLVVRGVFQRPEGGGDGEDVAA